jgi:hypothetical protein
VVLRAVRLDVAEIFGELVAVEEIRMPLHDGGRTGQLCAVDDRPRSAGLVHEDVGDLVLVGDQRVVQLVQASLPQLHVARPVGRVEGAACRGNRPADIADSRISGDTEHLFRGRRLRLVSAAALGFGQFTVDQQPLFVPHLPEISLHARL